MSQLLSSVIGPSAKTLASLISALTSLLGTPTSVPAAGVISQWDTGGCMKTNTPTISTHATNKTYVDTAVASIITSTKVPIYIHSTQTSSFTAAVWNFYTANISSGTATLPDATTFVGAEICIYNINATALTINTTSSQTVQGFASGVLTLAQYESHTYVSDGANWVFAEHTVATASATAATINTLALRDGNGNSSFATPTSGPHAATKSYVDTAVAGIITAMTIGSTQTANFNAVNNTHYPVSLSSGNVVAALPAANSYVGQVIEFFITAASSTPGTNSLTWSSQVSDTIQGNMTGATEADSSFLFRSVGGNTWRLVART